MKIKKVKCRLRILMLAVLMLFISADATACNLWVKRHITHQIYINWQDIDDEYAIQFPSRKACEQKIEEINLGCLELSKKSNKIVCTDGSLSFIDVKDILIYSYECKDE